MGMGQYPNMDTQEAFVVVGTPERQYNLRLARTLWPTPGVTKVGPFSVVVLPGYPRYQQAIPPKPAAG